MPRPPTFRRSSRTIPYCDYNFCEFNPFSGAIAFYQPCNSAGMGDGICQPFPNNSGGYYGICLRPGPNSTASSCDGLLGQVSNNCVAQDICIPLNEPADPCSQTFQQSSVCLPTCNADAGSNSCPDLFGNQTTCKPYAGDPPGNLLEAGICQ
jgi:hypothetical protein